MTYTTISDAYAHYVTLMGDAEELRTQDELRSEIHARGLRYEEITDENLWNGLFESGWAYGQN